MSVSRFPFWRVAPGERVGEFILPVMPPATVGPEGAPHVMGGVALAARKVKPAHARPDALQ